MIDQKTRHLALPLPHEANDLAEDNPRLIQAFGIIDRELFRTMQANVLLEDGGKGMYEQLLAVLASTAKTELRTTRVELELLRLSGRVEGTLPVLPPGYDPETGAYLGPIAVGTSIMDLGQASLLFQLQEEQDADAPQILPINL